MRWTGNELAVKTGGAPLRHTRIPDHSLTLLGRASIRCSALCLDVLAGADSVPVPETGCVWVGHIVAKGYRVKDL